MQESDRNELAETLQNKTALSRMTHGEILSAIVFLEGTYEISKKPVYEEQAFSMPALAEAVIEGEDHPA